MNSEPGICLQLLSHRCLRSLPLGAGPDRNAAEPPNRCARAPPAPAFSMELRAVNRIMTVESIGCSEANMSARSAKEFDEFAGDCVRLAEQADTPMLREKLLNLAREWMRAV